MTSLVQTLGDRVVGTVEEVTADRITVLLDPEAPRATALNTGAPAGFPRINGYVLIPNESGATACVISSVRIERLPFPKRKGMQKDFGLVDLPFPARVMSLTPLGTLKDRSTAGDLSFEVRRGVDVFPLRWRSGCPPNARPASGYRRRGGSRNGRSNSPWPLPDCRTGAGPRRSRQTVRAPSSGSWKHGRGQVLLGGRSHPLVARSGDGRPDPGGIG